MQVIDTSALLAVIYDEPEHDHFAMLLARGRNFISAATVFEAEVAVMRRLGPEKARRVRALLAEVGAEVIPFDNLQADLAYSAYLRFGKGRHPARLGLLDCAAYALAQSLNAPLLYKGGDFVQTDVRSLEPVIRE